MSISPNVPSSQESYHYDGTVGTPRWIAVVFVLLFIALGALFNVDSVFVVGKAVARRMIPRQRGKIINTCSVQSELGRPNTAAYAASKGAVKMLTKTMCAEWAKHGITANGISPGYFGTELNTALMNDEKFSAWVCARTPAG